MNAFCASENFEAFIVFRSSQPGENTAENSNSERPSFRGADQASESKNKSAMAKPPRLGYELLDPTQCKKFNKS